MPRLVASSLTPSCLRLISQRCSRPSHARSRPLGGGSSARRASCVVAVCVGRDCAGRVCTPPCSSLASEQPPASTPQSRTSTRRGRTSNGDVPARPENEPLLDPEADAIAEEDLGLAVNESALRSFAQSRESELVLALAVAQEHGQGAEAEHHADDPLGIGSVAGVEDDLARVAEEPARPDALQVALLRV